MSEIANTKKSKAKKSKAKKLKSFGHVLAEHPELRQRIYIQSNRDKFSQIRLVNKYRVNC